MPYTETVKNGMLDSQTFDGIQLHSGDPGPAGTANSECATQAATFNAASSSARALSANVEVTGMTGSVAITHFSVWGSTTFQGSEALSGDQAANAEGAYTLLAVGTALQINDS